MKITGNRRQRNRRGRVVAAGISFVLGLSAAGIAQADTCKGELDRFERRLHSSSLAATDPDTFRALVRQAEEAALLRDEQQCLKTVAALNEAVPEDADAGMKTTPGANNEAPTAQKSSPSRPAAPVLLMAGGDDANEADEQRKTASPASGDPGEIQLGE